MQTFSSLNADGEGYRSAIFKYVIFMRLKNGLEISERVEINDALKLSIDFFTKVGRRGQHVTKCFSLLPNFHSVLKGNQTSLKCSSLYQFGLWQHRYPDLDCSHLRLNPVAFLHSLAHVN
ncbi:hypothetical protein NPIL_65991 [Nephila pilipes]|uniref:Uncharacterized protein n=1 Tax=Nephila pilipes TaxID=299642 RepID=A0A8X6U683_NEPPI|nr:hypothetical protein NPIL_65991 [Nephila pilipes]